MKALLSIALVIGFLGSLCHSQQTTTTDCTINGNSASCTSRTHDYDEERRRAEENQRQTVEAFGQTMQQFRFSRSVRKFCKKNPGQSWTYYKNKLTGEVLASGVCPTK
jgi:hypothetical protein